MYTYVFELSELILFQNKIYENVPLSMHGVAGTGMSIYGYYQCV